MITIGITGGIAAGKSTICSIFAKLGIPYYDSDNRVKILLNREEELIKKMMSLFGNNVYENDLFQRDFAAKRILANSKILEDFNKIILPYIKEDLEIFKIQHTGKNFICLESAILMQSDLKMSVDVTILVSAPIEERSLRTKIRDPFRSDAEIKHLIMSQFTDEDLRKICDYEIVNHNKDKNVLKQELDVILLNIKMIYGL